MDIRTGRTFASEEDAIAANVPKSDMAFVGDVDPANPETWPLVKFASGPFKDRLYRRMPNGQLQRVKI